MDNTTVKDTDVEKANAQSNHVDILSPNEETPVLVFFDSYCMRIDGATEDWWRILPRAIFFAGSKAEGGDVTDWMPSGYPQGSYRFLFQDSFMLNLRDESADAELLWGDKEIADLLATAPGMIEVATSVDGLALPVEVVIRNSPPDADFAEWDHVTECGIDIPSGKLLIGGCYSFEKQVARIPLPPSSYRVRIYYGKLPQMESVSDDHFKIVLWPSPDTTVVVLKQWIDVPDQLSIF